MTHERLARVTPTAAQRARWSSLMPVPGRSVEVIIRPVSLISGAHLLLNCTRATRRSAIQWAFSASSTPATTWWKCSCAQHRKRTGADGREVSCEPTLANAAPLKRTSRRPKNSADIGRGGPASVRSSRTKFAAMAQCCFPLHGTCLYHPEPGYYSRSSDVCKAVATTRDGSRLGARWRASSRDVAHARIAGRIV